jgi:hypothetical protein
LGTSLQQTLQQQQRQQWQLVMQPKLQHLLQQQQQLAAPPASLRLQQQLLLTEVQGGKRSLAQCMPTMHPHLHTAAAGCALTRAPARQPSSSIYLAAGVLLQQLLVTQHLQELQEHTAAGLTAGGSAACVPSLHHLQQMSA